MVQKIKDKLMNIIHAGNRKIMKSNIVNLKNNQIGHLEPRNVMIKTLMTKKTLMDVFNSRTNTTVRW